MKKTIAASLLCIAIGLQANAQTSQDKNGYVPTDRPSNEISISYGALPFTDIIGVTAGILTTGITGGGVTLSNVRSTGTFSLGYYWYCNNHVAVGCDLVYEHLKMTLNYKSGEVKDDNSNFLSILPGVKLPWFNFKHCGLYSKINAGLCVYQSIGESTENKKLSTSFAFQLTPIGVDFGGEAVRGFVEAGFGFQSTVSAGVRFAF